MVIFLNALFVRFVTELVRAQIIEPAAVSHPDIAKFLDNVHLSLL